MLVWFIIGIFSSKYYIGEKHSLLGKIVYGKEMMNVSIKKL